MRSEGLDWHIDELCAGHGIVREPGGRLGVRSGEVVSDANAAHRIAPVKGQVTYFVALHEIGHLVGKGRSGTRLEREAAAWRWAIEHAIVVPTDAARRSMGRRLRSYVRWAELRQHRRHPPVIPPASSSFWALLAALEA